MGSNQNVGALPYKFLSCLNLKMFKLFEGCVQKEFLIFRNDGNQK